MCRKRKMLFRTMLLMIFAVLLAMGATAAFFNDAINLKLSVKTGGISFSIPDGGTNLSGKDMDIKADLTDLDNRLEPLKVNDVLSFNFSTVYNGSTDAYLVPKLTLKIKNIKAGDTIEIYRVTDTGEEHVGNAAFSGQAQKEESFYLRPEYVKNGDVKSYSFKIKVTGLNGLKDAPPLMLLPEMSFAAAQAEGNKHIEAMGSGELAFKEIENAGSPSSNINGFTDVTGSDKTVNQDGKEIIGKKLYSVRLRPVIKAAEGDVSKITFYKSINGREQVIPSEGSELQICLNSSNLNTRIRYEVSNEAGTVSSQLFSFGERNGSIACYRHQ